LSSSQTPSSPAGGAHPAGAHLLEGPATLLLSAVCYGLNVIPARLAAQAGVGGADLAAWRSAAMLSALAAAVWLTRVSLAVPSAERMALFGFGASGALVGVGYLSSVAFIPVGVAVMIFYTYPALVALATPFVDGRRLTGAALVAFLLAALGVSLAVGTAAEQLDWRGVALAGLASVAAASQLFFGSRAPGGGGLRTLFWSQTAMIPVALIPVAAIGPATGQAWAAAAGPAALVAALYVAAFGLFTLGMRHASAAQAGVIYCLEPVVAIGAAALWLGERLSAIQYVGAALVLTGVALEIAARAFPVRLRSRK
jgi:drug/metabolite transporter (DMT)-like permease